MAAKEENESEILLGNKQLLAVFAVVALLLAVAFTGGYMLGKGSADKRKAEANETASDGSATTSLTKTVSPDEVPITKSSEPPAEEPTPTKPKPSLAEMKHEPVLGMPKEHNSAAAVEASPKVGQTFLQVSALTQTQAAAMAGVLRKQNFHARIAQKPGTPLYRVLVGPVKDNGELSSTRDSLRKIGFREVVVQRY